MSITLQRLDNSAIGRTAQFTYNSRGRRGKVESVRPSGFVIKLPNDLTNRDGRSYSSFRYDKLESEIVLT